MKKHNWYKLDNIGIFYSLTSKKDLPAVFRFSVSLKNDVDPQILQQALDETVSYFPNFNTTLRKGFFWYYLETSDNKVEVKEEHKEICSKIYKDEDDILYRVNYYKNRINFEISHIISDGRGSLTFFQCLVTKYIMLKEKIKDVELDIDSSISEKNEDSFDKYYTKEKLKMTKVKKMYQYKGKKNKKTTYMEYHISTKKVLELAHEYNVSLTSLLIAVFICGYKSQMKKVELNKTIKIDVPVDLRQFYKSNTSRNFFGMVSVAYKFDKEEYDFKDVVNSINEQLKNNMKEDQIRKRVNLMITVEKNPIVRIVPIFMKDFILKRIYSYAQSSTSNVSNIGNVKVDYKIEKYIENFNVITTTDNLRMTICSYKDDLSIGFANRYRDNDIIKYFCRFFSERDIPGVMNISKEDHHE